MNLRDVVGNIGLAGTPMDGDGTEGGAVTDPVLPHVQGLGALELCGLVGEAYGDRVVANDGCC